MLFDKYDEIESLDGVEQINSEFNESPLLDENVTIFFANGYRLISSKSILGQSIELEPFVNEIQGASFIANVFHEIEINGIKIKPEDSFYELHNDQKIDMSLGEFNDAVMDIVGKEVMDYLIKRHESIPFASVFAPRGPR